MKSENLTTIFLSEVNDIKNRLPAALKQDARKCLLDYLGVFIAGKKIFEDLHPDISLKKSENNHLIHTGLLALKYGISSHYIELDDGHRGGMLHLGAPIISALLEVAVSKKIQTENLFKGIIVGYEVAIRLACAIQPEHKLNGFHATGTCGSIGAAIGIAVALDYDFEQLKSTLAAAVTSASGILEMIEGDSEMKPFNAGKAAQNGVIAAYVGKARLKSPEDPLGGKRGFLKVMCENPRLEYVTDFSLSNFMIQGIYMKPYAACRHCHPSIEAALKIRSQEGFSINKIKSIEVETYKLAVEGHDHTEIEGVNSAKMSIPYSLSIALKEGLSGMDAYSLEKIENKGIQEITDKVKVYSTDELSALCPQRRVAIVTIKTDNAVFKERVDFPKGEPENPLSVEELCTKFRTLATFGNLSDKIIDEIIGEVLYHDFKINHVIDLIYEGN